MQAEAQQQSSLQKAVEEELEWVRSNAKGQQKKGKARLRAFDELQQQVRHFPVSTFCLHAYALLDC